MLNNKKRKEERLKIGTDEISIQKYNLTLGITVLYGFLVNAFMVATMSEFFASIPYGIFLIVYFIMILIGSIISVKSKQPIVSFAGYNLIVLPIGGLLSIFLPYYEGADILSAMLATGAVVATMMALSYLKPDFFAGLGKTLFLGLTLGLIAEIIALLLGYGGNFFNWLFVLLFSLYIGYDWHKAQAYPKTIDNAIDSAIDIYLDVINLFVRILSILSKDD